MKTFCISTNNYPCENKSVLFSCGEKLENELYELQYLGGFLRFNMECYSDKKEKESLKLNDFKLWLKENVFA